MPPSAAHLYPFPRRFLYLELIVICLICALVIFAWIPPILSIFRYGIALASTLRAALFLNFTALSLVLFHRLSKNNRLRTQFILSDDFLVYKTPLIVKKIRLTDIRSIIIKQFPVRYGIMVLKSERETMYIPLTLHNIGDLIAPIEHISTHFGHMVVPEETWQKIRQLGDIAENADRRAAAAFKPLIITSMVLPSSAIFIGALYWDMPIIPLLLWSVAGIIVPLCVYAAADITIRLRSPAGACDKNLRHGKCVDEKRVYAVCGLIFFFLYCVAGILYKALIL